MRSVVKLLGEMVGRNGVSMDPAKVQGIQDWAPIRNLKQLQEFLGTCNYSRSQVEPNYAHACEGLRQYLREGESAFPLTPRGEASVERLKGLVTQATALAVPDERAAAGGWRPYEQLADACGYAMGGAHVQMNPELTRVVPLAYFSKSLTPAQGLWHPYRQEHYAQLQTRRYMCSLFGSIPVRMYTDHANLVRLQDMPLHRVDPLA